MFMFDFFIMIVGVLLGVAFFTLLERKVLGYIHFRKGPTKIFFLGLFQPLADAAKLFSKENLKGYKFSYYMYVAGPFLGLFLMLVLWMIYGGFYGVYGSIFSFVYVFCFLSLGVYVFLLSGWGSNSKYSLVGAYRAVAQTISYEICMLFFGLFFVYVMSVLDLSFFSFYQFGFWFFFMSFLFFLGWLFVVFSESNRSPFDFSEGESELVSGFNVEYGGGLFSLFFISEYGMIIFLSFLSVMFFLGGSLFILKIIIFCFFFVWVRCCFPRYRYDLLMSSAWGAVLPFSLGFILVSVAVFL